MRSKDIKTGSKVRVNRSRIRRRRETDSYEVGYVLDGRWLFNPWPKCGQDEVVVDGGPDGSVVVPARFERSSDPRAGRLIYVTEIVDWEGSVPVEPFLRKAFARDIVEVWDDEAHARLAQAAKAQIAKEEAEKRRVETERREQEDRSAAASRTILAALGDAPVPTGLRFVVDYGSGRIEVEALAELLKLLTGETSAERSAFKSRSRPGRSPASRSARPSRRC